MGCPPPNLLRWTLCCLVALPGSAAAVDVELAADHAQLQADYARRLAELEDWCRARRMDAPAATLRAWLPDRDPQKLYLYLVGDLRDDPAPDAEGPREPAEWKTRFGTLRRAQAESLVQLARRAAGENRCGLAFRWLAEALREDPDHAVARRVFGYRQVNGSWQSAYAAQQLERGYVWHARFGWLKAGDLEHYEAGLRRMGKRWVDVETERRRRSDMDHGWRIESDHYRVTTNTGLETGVQLALRLERLHQVFIQVFADYYMNGDQLAGRFEQQRPFPLGRRPHAVYFYRSRDEYNDALRQLQPRIEMTLGIYFDRNRRSYFFDGEDQYAGTLYHEATHQLFHESRRPARRVARDASFWIVEGIAAYLESLSQEGDVWTLGGLETGRMPAARQRVLQDGFYVPLAQLTRMGVEDLQGHAEIARLYSQAAGLATFLMHGQAGRHRAGLINYLRAVYSGRADAGTLARLTGTSYAELDAQYKAFLTGETRDADDSR